MKKSLLFSLLLITLNAKGAGIVSGTLSGAGSGGTGGSATNVILSGDVSKAAGSTITTLSFQGTNTVNAIVNFNLATNTAVAALATYEIQPQIASYQPTWTMYSGGTFAASPVFAPSPFTVTRAAVCNHSSGFTTIYYDLPPNYFNGAKTNAIDLYFGYTNGLTASFQFTVKLLNTNYATAYTPIDHMNYTTTVPAGTNIITISITNATGTAWSNVAAAWLNIYDNQTPSATVTNCWFLGGTLRRIN